MAWGTEAELEAVFLDQLEGLEYAVAHGSSILPEMRHPQRPSFRDTILGPVLRESITRLNPDLPSTAIDEVALRLEDIGFASDLDQQNRRLHDLTVNDVVVTYLEDGEERHARAHVVD